MATRRVSAIEQSIAHQLTHASAIMAADPPIPLDPRDKALLRPLAQLGKSGASGAGVSFLRRTEYISHDANRKFNPNSYKEVRDKQNETKRRKLAAGVDKEDPLNILRNVIKGFDVAYPGDAYAGEDTADNIQGADITPVERRTWGNPRHPSKPNVTLLDSYPVLPDLDALPSIQSYIILKFDPKSLGEGSRYDPRLDVAILRPQNPDQDGFEVKMDAYQRDKNHAKPTTEYDYDYYLADSADSVAGIKRKFDTADPSSHEDEELYTSVDDGQRFFRYDRLRGYETTAQTGDGDNPYADSVAIALHDGEGSGRGLQKGAYFYPILQRTSLRPKRSRYVEQQVIDQLRVMVRDADEEETRGQLEAKAKWDPTVVVPAGPDEEDGDAAADADAGVDGETSAGQTAEVAMDA